MVCQDYVNNPDVTIDEIVNKCRCFLYDVHDPDSCSMGAIYLSSPYGAGQDPWMYAAFVALVLYIVGYLRFSKGRCCPTTSIGHAIYDQKFWGRVCVGGGLAVCFVDYFFMRFVFAFGSFNFSRNCNVSTLGIFNAAYIGIYLGLMNCWWITLVNRQKERHGEDSMEHENPGILRKTALVLGATFDPSNDRCKKWLRYLVLGVEGLFVLAGFVYVIVLFVLGIIAGRNRDDTAEHHLYIIVAIVFWSVIALSLIDTVVSYAIHRFVGMKYAIAAAGKESTTTPGRYGIAVEVNETLWAWLPMLFIAFSDVYFFTLVAGKCPYLPPEKDIYHGGDPAEFVGQDIANLLFFCSLCKFFANFIFRETLFFWREKGYEDPNAISYNNGTHLPGAKAHPKYDLYEMISSISASFCTLIIAGAIIIVDIKYKVDAGMLGRILYLLGFFLALAALSDQDLYFIILDGRQRIFWIERILSLAVVLTLVVVYLLGASYWLTKANHMRLTNGKDQPTVPPFDKIFLWTSLGCVIAKKLIIYMHVRRLEKLHMTGEDSEGESKSYNPDALAEDNQDKVIDPDVAVEAEDEDMAEGGKSQENEEADEEAGAAITSHSVVTDIMKTSNHYVEVSYPYLKIFDDFAGLVKLFFTVWLVAAVVWNAMGILILIVILCWIHRIAIMEIWMKQDGETADRRIGLKRSFILMGTQLILFCVYFMVLTQIFYYAGSQLEYYREQMLIGGHRGVWTKGYAENSFEAFDYADSAGYHFVEMDYRMTLDQKLIVMHDTTLDRTTNGTGPVYAYDFEWQQENLRLKKVGNDELIEEFPYSMEEIIDYCGAGEGGLNISMNHEVKQDSNMSAIPLALNSICERNAMKNSFISTGDTRFQHILSRMEPEISLEKDFLLHTSSMAMTVPRNVNMYANSNLLLFFNTWMIPNQHAIGNGVICYFLALESPFFLHYFKLLGVDIFMLNNPQHCVDAGMCPPKKKLDLPRWIGQSAETGQSAKRK